MSNPTAVFLKCGSISFAAGLAIWLLLLQLHDKASKSKSELDPANPSPEHSDILRELEIAVAPPKPVAEPPRRETRALPAPVDMRTEPREEHAMPASAEVRGDLLETRLAQKSVETRIAFAPEPPPAETRLRNAGPADPVITGSRPSPSAFVAVHPPEPQPKSYKPASLSPPTLLPTPPLPERRPQRMAASDEPRSIQAITQRQPPRKPGLTWDGAVSFLTNLWRSPDPTGRPMSRNRECDDAAGAAPATPCSRVGTRFMRR